jgi:SAM-dependent methyltransferase
MKQIIYDEYHEFLKKRTFKSKIYRKYLLFPTLCKFLSGRVLDVGSGIGDFVAFRPNTIGVDINPDNVEFCKKHRNLDVRLMEINSLPFDDEHFDSINMDNVLEHIEDPEIILDEMTRVLKKGGILVVGVPGKLGFKTGPDHEVFYSKEDLRKTFTSLNYSVVKIFSMPIECDWLDNLMRQYCYYGVFKKN